MSDNSIITQERDMDLIRTILLQLEQKPPHKGFYQYADFELDNYSKDVVHDHFYLLGQSGLVEYQDLRTLDDPGCYALKQLTWNGQEFLQAIKSDTTWNKVKRVIGKMNSTTFDVVESVTTQILTDEASNMVTNLLN